MSAVFDALVVGSGLPALLVALDLAETDLRVAVVASATEFDLPDGPELDHEQGLRALIERIAEPLAGSTQGHAAAGPGSRSCAPAPVLLRNAAGAWLRQSEPEVFGVPAVPLSAESIALLGTGGALRAYLDRVTPVLTIGKTRGLGRLARRRLGRTAFDRLVEPQLRDRFGADEVEVAVAAPGLNEALTRTGALTAAALAYSERHVARETRVVPEDEWSGLVSRLRKRLEFYGVELVDAEVTSAHREGTAWEVRTAEVQRAPLRSRALVVDADVVLAGRQHPLRALLPTGLPSQRARAYASAGIQAPAELVGETGGAPLTAVCTVTAADEAEPWTLRIERPESGDWRAHLSGPAVLDPAGEMRSATAAILQTVCALGDRLALVPTSGWRVRVAAAPFVAVDERDAAEQRLDDASAAESAPLWLGRALHGDSLSATLADADRRAVRLRRRLLGLEAD